MAAAADPRTGIEFLPVPGGEFRMGHELEDEDARGVHPVRVTAFEIGRCEVTRAQYARFMADTSRPAPAQWSNPRFTGDTHPVVGVTWDDAAAFCLWAGGRLPTEAEWEFAARGADGRRYPWGAPLPDKTRAVFHLDIGFGGTMPVGSAPEGRSPFGVLDMAGNVFEWCSDWYDAAYYARSERDNPRGPESGDQRVVRGGSWISLPDACYATRREKYPPAARSTLIGIRVVRRSA